MTIKQQGGIFGRNPTFSNVTVDGTLTVDQIVEKTGAAGITLDGVTLKDGNVVLADGKGIDFSATAGTGTSELFDDYEEGDWTPVVADAASGGNEASAIVDARYTKVGNVVTVVCAINNIDTTGLTSGNDLYITGLPFTSYNLSTLGQIASSVAVTNITFSGYLAAVLQDNQTYIRLAETTSGGATLDFVTVGELSASADIYFSQTYLT